jgi:hypothetical protein
MTRTFTCPVCQCHTNDGPPGVCGLSFQHTPAAALDAKVITPAQFDEYLRGLDRRLYHLEQQLRERVSALETEANLNRDGLPPLGPPPADPYPLTDAGQGC